MRKLSDEWKLQELFSQYNYIKKLHDIHRSEYDIKRLKIAEGKIIENYKVINKNSTEVFYANKKRYYCWNFSRWKSY